MPVLRSSRRSAAVACAVAMALAALAVPASAGTPAGQFEIIVAKSDHTERHWTLSCRPDGGKHPTPKAACDRLRAIGGDLEQIRRSPRPCIQLYDPRQVEIIGRWDGEVVNFNQTYTNPSCMAAAAAPIVPDVRD